MIKQHITFKEFYDLPEEQKENLLIAVGALMTVDFGNYHKIFTIGKMIEILDQELNWNWTIFTEPYSEDEKQYAFEGDTHDFEIMPRAKELCDCLWQAVKEVLC